MSAYLVNKEHIDYLVGAMMYQCAHSTGGYFFGGRWVMLKAGDHDALAKCGQMLWSTNEASVDERYPAEDGTPPEPPIKYGKWGGSVFQHYDPVQVIKSAHCLDYQSCELDDWKKTEAYAFCEQLIRAACDRLEGYDAAQWGPPKAGTVAHY